MSEPTLKDLAKMIDHSLLHPTMTDADLRKGCELSRQYDVATAWAQPTPVAAALPERAPAPPAGSN